ncbi:MAG: DUF1624 domain-containing protein [Ignavibacteriaceae bacterium]|nr:DUF1624 domain-containing protein [Ignavibacteriaceae bacterium]
MNLLSHLFATELKGRNLTADFLKGMAVLFMIQVHITELLAQPDFFGSWAGKVSLFLGGPPAAPVFMAVMGYFLAGSKKSLSRGLLRGVNLILGGILLNIFLNASLLYNIYSGELFLNPWHYILGADILPLAGLSVMIIALFRKLFNDNLWAGGLFLTLMILVNQFLPRGVQQENEYIRYTLAFLFTNEYWSYFPLFPWLVYPFAGYLFRLLEPRLHFSADMLKVLSVSLIALLFGAGRFFYEDIVNLPRWYHHDLWLILFNFLFLAGYMPLFRLTAEYFKKNTVILWTIWLGKNVTAAYVIQWIILGNAGTHLYKTVSWEWLGVWFVTVCVVVTLLTVLFGKVKGLYKSREV